MNSTGQHNIMEDNSACHNVEAKAVSSGVMVLGISMFQGGNVTAHRGSKTSSKQATAQPAAPFCWHCTPKDASDFSAPPNSSKMVQMQPSRIVHARHLAPQRLAFFTHGVAWPPQHSFGCMDVHCI